MSTAIRYRLATMAIGGPHLAHVAPRNAQLAQAATTPKVSRLARMLALSYAIDRRIEAGHLKDMATAARRLGLTRARITQISNLRWLPVEIQEGILDGSITASERNLRGGGKGGMNASCPSSPRYSRIGLLGSYL